MAENEQPQPAATANPAPTAEAAPPSTPPLTVESIRDALLPEIEKRLKPAYDAARRAEAKAERAPDRFREYVAPMEEALESLLSQNMSEDQKEAFKAKRDLAKATRRDPDAEQQAEVASFQLEAASVLEEEGIKADDPILAAAYAKLIAGANTPAKWRTALGRAVAAVHRDRAKQAESSAGEREKKAREDERTKILNERRGNEGPIDKGQPASSNQKKDWLAMTDAEFKVQEAARDAERRARMIASR